MGSLGLGNGSLRLDDVYLEGATPDGPAVVGRRLLDCLFNLIQRRAASVIRTGSPSKPAKRSSLGGFE